MHAMTFRALGEPNRLRIVELLRSGPLSVGEIGEQLGIRQPQVSKHLRVLGESGLVTRESRARQRIYQLDPPQFLALEQWIESFERTWDARLDRLGTFLHDTDPENGTT